MHTATSAYSPTGDLSNVAAYTDEELAVELADASRRMQQSAHNRTGIAHTDAKLAAKVLSAEQRARAHMVESRHVCADACQHAISQIEECRCRCGGANHGLVHRPGREAARANVRARVTRTGDVTLGAARVDDLASWGIPAVPVRRVVLVDEGAF